MTKEDIEKVCKCLEDSLETLIGLYYFNTVLIHPTRECIDEFVGRFRKAMEE